MLSSHIHILCISVLVAIVIASGPTSIFIDHVPEYHLLASCAENQVSLVVRDMSFGCGDDSKTTSYGCFCFSSSSKYSHMIDTRVASACTKDPSQNKTAIEVFSSYCELGDIAAVPSGSSSATDAKTTASSTQTGSASPASAPTTVTATVAPTETADSNHTSSQVVPIAVGVSVPVSVIALSALGYLLYRRRRRSQSRSPAELSGADHVNEAPPMQQVHELKRECRVPPMEIGDSEHRAELGTAVKDTYNHEPVHELDGGDRQEKSSREMGNAVGGL